MGLPLQGTCRSCHYAYSLEPGYESPVLLGGPQRVPNSGHLHELLSYPGGSSVCWYDVRTSSFAFMKCPLVLSAANAGELEGISGKPSRDVLALSRS
jgi:hypothetical protein